MKYTCFLNLSEVFKENFNITVWSGRRDLNPRPQPWQGCALPLSYARII